MRKASSPHNAVHESAAFFCDECVPFKAEDIVLDPFGGSGTTIIAAAKTNRIARVMELDPHYCDVIRKRWTAWAKENGKEVGSGGLQ